ncbi:MULTISPECIES: hypothetical protein [Amycolatopsis]|uniref:Uncharacterized protein n=1 Tax=Amycolatopsis dendrobii TaxID=2760662 RepID=A0A7W3VWD9_9PSEU|nr:MULTISPECIES: hypothetical protein [Amycolatopsis]MBB1154355.1 hypothetical protein [Amycolatopsis dendrobii]UKD51266.1 hypothetical protein L3Q65_25395 [Amycolatopsis sp. FU40]
MTSELTSLVSRLGPLTSEIASGDQAAAVADEEIAELLYAAARLFSAKTDRVGKIAWPIRADALTATETVVLVTALLDAADVNLFDMAIWYRRAV